MEYDGVLVAPDGFKDCLDSPRVCERLREGLQSLPGDSPRVRTHPLADGGPGTVRAMVDALSGSVRTRRVRGPRGDTVEAQWGWLGDAEDGPAAVVEMAAASGLERLDEEDRNPLRATSYGTGQLLREAADSGARTVYLGLGGSATVDGGLGTVQALGFETLDASGDPLPPTPDALMNLREIRDDEVPQAVRDLDVHICCDVDNPLLGPRGAARVYGPQKGADPAMVETLERHLTHWADTLESWTGTRIRERAGTGAAGGIGFALVGLLGAQLESGAELIMDATDFNSSLAGVDVLITGEGRMDEQSLHGKTPVAAARRARRRGVDCVMGVAGELGAGHEDLYDLFDLLLALPRGPITREESLREAPRLLRSVGADLARVLRLNRGTPTTNRKGE